MPRKPKTAPASPAGDGTVSGIAGTFPETVAGLAMVSKLTDDLLGDANQEAYAAMPIAAEIEDEAAEMVAFITVAAQMLTRASVAAGLLPREVLAGMEEVNAQTEQV